MKNHFRSDNGIPLQKLLKLRKEFPLEWWQKIWEKFYFEVYSIKIDLSRVSVADFRPDFKWLVYVIPDISLNKIYTKDQLIFSLWSGYDEESNKLDYKIPFEERDPRKIGVYVKRVRDRFEPDFELKNKSADDLKAEGITGNTLREALFLESFYFWFTGKHLDSKKRNLCAGSRDIYGNVPCLNWIRGALFADGALLVSSCETGASFEDLRSRAVV